MKKFKIPVSWEVCGVLEIEADNLEEALNIAHKNEDVMPLPEESNYIDSSFRIDDDLAEIYN